MKTKVVYCIVSTISDYYYEQLIISLTSLRKHNPDTSVTVICDKDTYCTFVDKRILVFELANEVIPIDTPDDWTNCQKSRFLKTNLRELVKGDYLFIDTDTVICSSLDFIDDIPFDIAAVKDSHVERPLPKLSHCQHETESWIWRNAEMVGVDVEGLWHYNSGVMLVRDTQTAYNLYEKWTEHYLKQLQYDVKIDQLPLLLANHEMDNVIAELDPKLNCQVSFQEGRKNVAGASIIHYFPGQGKTLLSVPWFLDPIKITGHISDSVQRIIDHPDQFFDKESKVMTGDAVALVETPSLLEVYNSCPKVFRVFVNILSTYLEAKKWLYSKVYS